jgi:hypothetical protein
MNDQLAQLQAQVAELMTWKAERTRQAIPYPLDDASKNSLNVVSIEGTLSTGLTQSVSVSSTPTSITVPAALVGLALIKGEGVTYKVGHYGTV